MTSLWASRLLPIVGMQLFLISACDPDDLVPEKGDAESAASAGDAGAGDAQASTPKPDANITANEDSDLDAGDKADAPTCGTDTYANYGKAFFATHCTACHGETAQAPAKGVRLDSLAQVMQRSAAILEHAVDLKAPIMPFGTLGLPAAERQRLKRWLMCDATLAWKDAGEDTSPGSDGGSAAGNDAGSQEGGIGRGDAGRDADSPRDASGSTRSEQAWHGTLVNVLDMSPGGIIKQPHQLELISAETGQPPSPPLRIVSEPTGMFAFDPPPPGEYWMHVIGRGPVSDTSSTFDGLHLWAPDSWRLLLAVSTIGTGNLFTTTGQFTAQLDRVPVSGMVFRVDKNGKHIGIVGCSKIFLDDLPGPAIAYDQRYIAASGLPATLAEQDRTLRSGKWYFGNLTKGRHTFRVSVDDGKSFIAEKTVFLPFVRADAISDYKSIYVWIGIDVPGADPTPANCPQP